MDWFCILATVNNAAMNIGVLMFFRISVLGCFRYIPRSQITGPKGRSIFNFLRYLHTAFHSGCTNLHSHQQSKRFPVLYILVSTCCLLIYWWLPLWYLIVVLICISPITTDIEHLFMSIGHVYVFFGEVSIHDLCPKFFNWAFWDFFVVVVEFYRFFINFGYETHIRCVCKYVLTSHGLYFYFVDVFLCCAKTF